jgi:hypothetical protein
MHGQKNIKLYPNFVWGRCRSVADGAYQSTEQTPTKETGRKQTLLC